MPDASRNMMLTAFAADALALGVHWIYNTRQIADSHGRVESLTAPGPDSYHRGKGKGDFTHYGDQMLVLLASVAEGKGFDLGGFSRKWRKLFEDYKGYFDGATKNTLANYEKGAGAENAGSIKGDFAGAARIIPVVYACLSDEDQMIAAARSQTAMTHNDPDTVDAAEFFARVLFRVLKGAAPTAAIKEVAALDAFEMSPIAMWTEEGMKCREEESVAAIARFGQACETRQVFPGVIHLIARYENDLKEALIQSVMAGGESAARGIMVGAVLGAYSGNSGPPQEWIEGVNQIGRIREYLDQVTS